MTVAHEIINLIIVIAGVIAAAGGLWAARAAHRSAVTAQEAAERAERVDRRGLLRDLITTAHRVVAESMQVGSLTEELKTEYRILAIFLVNLEVLKRSSSSTGTNRNIRRYFR
jgi:hypothetical protein